VQHVESYTKKKKKNPVKIGLFCMRGFKFLKELDAGASQTSVAKKCIIN
jgi:hypothetical protein